MDLAAFVALQIAADCIISQTVEHPKGNHKAPRLNPPLQYNYPKPAVCRRRFAEITEEAFPKDKTTQAPYVYKAVETYYHHLNEPPTAIKPEGRDAQIAHRIAMRLDHQMIPSKFPGVTVKPMGLPFLVEAMYEESSDSSEEQYSTNLASSEESVPLTSEERQEFAGKDWIPGRRTQNPDAEGPVLPASLLEIEYFKIAPMDALQIFTRRHGNPVSGGYLWQSNLLEKAYIQDASMDTPHMSTGPYTDNFIEDQSWPPNLIESEYVQDAPTGTQQMFIGADGCQAMGYQVRTSLWNVPEYYLHSRIPSPPPPPPPPGATPPPRSYIRPSLLRVSLNKHNFDFDPNIWGNDLPPQDITRRDCRSTATMTTSKDDAGATGCFCESYGASGPEDTQTLSHLLRTPSEPEIGRALQPGPTDKDSPSYRLRTPSEPERGRNSPPNRSQVPRSSSTPNLGRGRTNFHRGRTRGVSTNTRGGIYPSSRHMTFQRSQQPSQQPQVQIQQSSRQQQAPQNVQHPQMVRQQIHEQQVQEQLQALNPPQQLQQEAQLRAFQQPLLRAQQQAQAHQQARMRALQGQVSQSQVRQHVPTQKPVRQILQRPMPVSLQASFVHPPPQSQYTGVAMGPMYPPTGITQDHPPMQDGQPANLLDFFTLYEGGHVQQQQQGLATGSLAVPLGQPMAMSAGLPPQALQLNQPQCASWPQQFAQTAASSGQHPQFPVSFPPNMQVLPYPPFQAPTWGPPPQAVDSNIPSPTICSFAVPGFPDAMAAGQNMGTGQFPPNYIQYEALLQHATHNMTPEALRQVAAFGRDMPPGRNPRLHPPMPQGLSQPGKFVSQSQQPVFASNEKQTVPNHSGLSISQDSEASTAMPPPPRPRPKRPKPAIVSKLEEPWPLPPGPGETFTGKQSKTGSELYRARPRPKFGDAEPVEAHMLMPRNLLFEKDKKYIRPPPGLGFELYKRWRCPPPGPGDFGYERPRNSATASDKTVKASTHPTAPSGAPNSKVLSLGGKASKTRASRALRKPRLPAEAEPARLPQDATNSKDVPKGAHEALEPRLDSTKDPHDVPLPSFPPPPEMSRQAQEVHEAYTRAMSRRPKDLTPQEAKHWKPLGWFCNGFNNPDPVSGLSLIDWFSEEALANNPGLLKITGIDQANPKAGPNPSGYNNHTKGPWAHPTHLEFLKHGGKEAEPEVVHNLNLNKAPPVDEHPNTFVDSELADLLQPRERSVSPVDISDQSAKEDLKAEESVYRAWDATTAPRNPDASGPGDVLSGSTENTAKVPQKKTLAPRGAWARPIIDQLCSVNRADVTKPTDTKLKGKL